MPDLTDYRSYKIGESTSLDRMVGFITPEFEQTVMGHILGNYLDATSSPLFLAIHGPMGSGKTYQTLRICSKYHLSVYYISAAELSGSYEKSCINDINRNLDNAKCEYETTNEYSVFIIDDFHLSIASTEAGIGKTVNSQILTGYLMNLADTAKITHKVCVPFILLGNDFRYLYPPLTRDGRMDFYEWNPTVDEKKSIIQYSFQDIFRMPEEKAIIDKLVEKYHNEPISFFTELKHDIKKAAVQQYFSEHKNSYRSISRLVALYNDVRKTEEPLAEKLDELAEKRHQLNQRALFVHENRGGLTNEKTTAETTEPEESALE